MVKTYTKEGSNPELFADVICSLPLIQKIIPFSALKVTIKKGLVCVGIRLLHWRFCRALNPLSKW